MLASDPSSSTYACLYFVTDCNFSIQCAATPKEAWQQQKREKIPIAIWPSALRKNQQIQPTQISRRLKTRFQFLSVTMLIHSTRNERKLTETCQNLLFVYEDNNTAERSQRRKKRAPHPILMKWLFRFDRLFSFPILRFASPASYARMFV